MNKMFNLTRLLACLFLTCTLVNASEITFSKQFLTDGISTLIEVSAGGYIGSSDGQQYPALVRFDDKGNAIDALEYVIQGKSGGAFDQVIETKDAGYAAIGGLHVQRRPIIAKVDVDGKPQWQIVIGDREDQLIWIGQTKDSGYVVVGRKPSPSSNYATWILKLTEKGHVSWSKTIVSQGYGALNFVKETSDNGFLIAGTLDDRQLVAKLDSLGNLIWHRLYSTVETTSLSVNSAVSTSDNGLVLAGLYGTGWGTVLLIRVGSQGGIVWAKTFDSGHHALAPFSITSTRDNGFLAAGVSDVYRGFDNRGVLFKVSSQGKLLWSRRTWSWLFSVDENHDGGISISGMGAGFYGILKANSKGLIPGCNLLKRFPLKVKSPRIIVSSDQDLQINAVSVQSEPLIFTPRRFSVSGEDVCH